MGITLTSVSVSEFETKRTAALRSEERRARRRAKKFIPVKHVRMWAADSYFTGGPLETSSDPKGRPWEEGEAQFVNGSVLREDGAAQFKVVTMITTFRNRVTGEIRRRVSAGAGWYAAPGSGADVCGYCGYIGPRSGWDCGHCGGS